MPSARGRRKRRPRLGQRKARSQSGRWPESEAARHAAFLYSGELRRAGWERIFRAPGSERRERYGRGLKTARPGTSGAAEISALRLPDRGGAQAIYAQESGMLVCEEGMLYLLFGLWLLMMVTNTIPVQAPPSGLRCENIIPIPNQPFAHSSTPTTSCGKCRRETEDAGICGQGGRYSR
eukprot:GFKZ01015552.1.p1 GENE.GFKZ01015552.1~~GFKZ01015552.1.p1  ORF type:complete len:179 (-),score=6.54 GFKZ01015552.1:240-776(-)